MPFGGTSIDRVRKTADAVRRHRIEERKVHHEDPDAKTKRARTALEKTLTTWMRHHGGSAFEQPFSPDHERVIEKIEQAINKGGLFALAMPRGHGKSTILKWATLYCLLTGRRKYVVVVAATAEMAQSIIEFVRQQIQESDTLHAHYPHVTTYARATDGKAIKARYQLRADGKASGIQWSKNTLVLPEVLTPDGKPYPSNGGILEGHGLTGAIRGKWRDTKTGKVLRPDFVLCDDPQTRESAESESQCNMRERIITGDVLGLAGPRKKIAAVMPCTIVQPGDLAARFLDHERHPEWGGETCRLVNKWPDEQDGLWAEYARLYKTGIAEGRGNQAAFDFYRANRDAMDRGAEVAWEHRIRDGELSALQTAENLLIEMGDQFWAEYQNDPKGRAAQVYVLTPQLVASRVEARPPGQIPEWARTVIAATDVNRSYALTSVIIAFGHDQTAAVLWYGTQKLSVSDDMPEPQKRKILYEALAEHGQRLAGLPCRPRVWTIDGGGTPEGLVIQFAANSQRICGIPAWCSFGRGWKTYRASGKPTQKITPGEQLHLTFERNDRQWLIYNADHWREIAQRGWTGAPGSPGSCSLPKGHHVEFAEQICREQLAGKTEVAGRTVWVWNTAPGPHDYGDCMQMAYMLAAHVGITSSGVVAAPRRYVERRRPKIGVEQ